MDTQTFELSVINDTQELLAQSRSLLGRADQVKIGTDDDLKMANMVKNDINRHAQAVSAKRMEITRPLDALKKTILDREREITDPLNKAKANVGSKILSYVAEQERKAAAERERVVGIGQQFADLFKPAMTRIQVEAAQSKAKAVISNLSPEDRDLPQVKLAAMNLSNQLSQRLVDIEAEAARASKKKIEDEQARQDRERRELEAERDRQALAKAQLEADKEAIKAERERPKSNIVEVAKFEVIDPDAVPRELCSPDPVKIRAYQKLNPNVAPVGVRYYSESTVR